ncbi:MAG: hydroxylamine reductase [Parachlamydiales bacterium]|nr:hydroxylamine reductase [Parachlamydiales bacterium]
MSMFCYQCQETFKNQACTVKGICGKQDDTANLQDLLIYILQGIALYANSLKEDEFDIRKYGVFICRALFSTITNANFDNFKIAELIKEAIKLRNELKKLSNIKITHDSANYEGNSMDDFLKKSNSIGILSYSSDEDNRSLKSTILYGMKGIAAYTDHAAILGFYNDEIFKFMIMGLSSITKNISNEKLIEIVMQTADNAVKAMKLLDEANTTTYGHPEITNVNIGVRNNPAILISGHDLKDMHELLEQTKNTGVDIYTHSEMLPANYYPKFKKYKHFVGNYGSSWWAQNKEFETFNGPILMTTNCIIPVKDSYKNRIFTTGMAGYPGVEHIPDRKKNNQKDFSKIIELAKTCPSPIQIEEGEIIGGFAHNQVIKLADKIVESIKSKDIKRFIVMGGCDGRLPDRKYYTKLAEKLSKDTIILTAGCAKYRNNKLKLGDINGIPRVLDAGQCNDCYSLAIIALKLKELFGLDDLSKLPLSFDIAWYEQKAVAVLLAMLSLGFKNIRLGPTLPAFLSKNVLKVLVDKFDIKPINSKNLEDDINAMMKGE